MKNQKVSTEQAAQIRSLDDFDMMMLVSDIHDHGWPIAAGTLKLIINAQTRGEKDQQGRLRRKMT